MDLAITRKFQSLLGVEYKSDGSNPIKYKAVYYWYMAWTLLGAEFGYLVVLPFWWWNVDGHVMRHALIVTVATMYIGQWIKSYTPWPRPPCPPVVRLEHIYVAESTMPSTHACLGTALPFSILFFSLQLYDLSPTVGFSLATFCAVNICFSRLYLGMHYLSDIIVGCALSFIMLYVLHSYTLYLDVLMLGYPYLCILGAIILATIFPAPSSNENSLRADTCRLLGVLLAIFIGFKIFSETGLAQTPCPSPSKRIIVPEVTLFRVFICLSRFVLGLPLALFVRAASRGIINSCLMSVINSFPPSLRPPKGISVKRWGPYEIPFYLISYTLIALAITFMAYPYMLIGLTPRDYLTNYPAVLKVSSGNPFDFLCVPANYNVTN